MIPVQRFASDPDFDKYQTETGAVSSLFEHSFNNAVKVRQNIRFAHVEGIYRSAYPNVYFDPYNPAKSEFSVSRSRRGAPWSASSGAAKPARTV